MINPDVFSIKIGGEAGQGIKSAGLMLAKFAARSGYSVYDYIEYPSLIRGGHNVMQVNISKSAMTGPYKKTDFLIALNLETITLHIDEVPSGGIVIFDEKLKVDGINFEGLNIIKMPFVAMAKEAGGQELLVNIVAVASAVGLLGGDISILKDLIKEEFGDKGENVVGLNFAAATVGYEFVKENNSSLVREVLKKMDNPSKKMVITGNEACALGAIAGGLQFAAIYPMSPASNILHVLAANQEKYGFIYKQPEDELSAINMAIGASFAGARTMTSTSGGGFCLMTEGYGLAGMTETPVVIVEGMRGAPATGLPTWNEQGDLRFVLHAHQGDFPRIVLAAGDAKETYDLTRQAFNLAEKYQCPVLLLLDKNICENDQSFEYFSTSDFKLDRGKLTFDQKQDYKRYQLSDDGISERSVPGCGNFFIANSDEHNEFGYSTEEIEDRNKQMQKRMKKLEICESQDMVTPVLYGPENADITLVSWGSNKGGILEGMKNFGNVNYIHINWINPFPAVQLEKMLKNAKYLVNIECNYTGQMAGIIKEKTGIDIVDKMLKYDGRPFFAEEIVQKLESLQNK